MINDTDALLVALQTLDKIEEIAEEISGHNYQDSTTIDLCRDVEIHIKDLHAWLQDRGSKAFNNYREINWHEKAESSHP